MRNPERINRILTILQKIWESQPDVRFNQLVTNLQYIYSQENNNWGQKKMIDQEASGDMNTSYIDLFYLEDEEWEAFLSKYLDGMEEKRRGKASMISGLEKAFEKAENDAIAVAKMLIEGKTVEEIAATINLSFKEVLHIKEKFESL